MENQKKVILFVVIAIILIAVAGVAYSIKAKSDREKSCDGLCFEIDSTTWHYMGGEPDENSFSTKEQCINFCKEVNF